MFGHRQVATLLAVLSRENLEIAEQLKPRLEHVEVIFVVFDNSALVIVRLSSRPSSFDDLVGAGEQRFGHVEAERLCGLDINDKFKLHRLLNRNIGRLCSA